MHIYHLTHSIAVPSQYCVIDILLIYENLPFFSFTLFYKDTKSLSSQFNNKPINKLDTINYRSIQSFLLLYSPFIGTYRYLFYLFFFSVCLHYHDYTYIAVVLSLLHLLTNLPTTYVIAIPVNLTRT